MPKARELNGGRGNAHGGQKHLQKSCLISRASRPRNCTCVEENMKLCLGVVIAAGLTLPAFGEEAVKASGIYQLNLAKSTIRGPIGKSQTLNYAEDAIAATGFDFNGKPYAAVFPRFYDRKAASDNGFTSLRHSNRYTA
jgi:hypothetical protein